MTDDRSSAADQPDIQTDWFSWYTLAQAFGVCCCLFAYALIGESLTGLAFSSLLTGLSDPALLILLTAALTASVGLNIIANAGWTKKLAISLLKLVLDAYAFVLSGFILASALLAFHGLNSVALLSFFAPLFLASAAFGFFWILRDFHKTVSSGAVRLIVGSIIVLAGPAIIMFFQLE